MENSINSVIIIGSEGRMGRSIISVISETDNFQEIVGVDPHASDHAPLTPEQLQRADVAIDFSSPSGTKMLLDVAAQCDTPLIIGTTGLGSSLEATIRDLSTRIPIVHASNFSTGVNLLISLVETASRVLGDEFCPEIMEIHHKMKKDAPSGTALSLGDALAATRGFKADNFITAREGMVGERPCDRVGIMALRGGDVVGEHTVYFLGSGERIELTHRASDRSIFARGAWRAASWVVGRPAGLYSMADVLGI